MLTLTIDNQTVQAPEHATVLQAIRHFGVRFPTLCFWEGLPPYSACRLCAVCPTGAVKMADIDGQRVLTTWHTAMKLQPCPGCGRPFTPEPMNFLREHVPDIEHVWGPCPACRRQQVAAG